MHPEHEFFVYIVASESRALYTGMANNLVRRVWQHKAGLVKGFAAKEGADRLVYYETYPYAADAIAREKVIKGWTATERVALIESINPEWKDLAADWFAKIDPENPPQQW
jgi:putative endonuclease